MAQRVESYDVFVAADTPPGTFASSLDFPPGVVTAIEARIPGGHSGKTGLQLWYNDSQLLPITASRWFKGNKTRLRVELEDPFPGGLGWRAEAYNTGKRGHTFEVHVELDELGAGALFPPVILLREAGVGSTV